MRMRVHGPYMRVDRRSGGTQNNRFPPLPVIHPSFRRIQVASCELRSRHQMRINPSFDADASLMYFESVEGRDTIEFIDDESFDFKKRLSPSLFLQEIYPSLLSEVIHVLLGEKHIDIIQSAVFLRSWTRFSLLASQTRIFLQSSPEKISVPS